MSHIIANVRFIKPYSTPKKTNPPTSNPPYLTKLKKTNPPGFVSDP